MNDTSMSHAKMNMKRREKLSRRSYRRYRVRRGEVWLGFGAVYSSLACGCLDLVNCYWIKARIITLAWSNEVVLRYAISCSSIFGVTNM